MNVFEDLVDELKKDNLLEETVIDTVSDAAPETDTRDSGDHSVDVEQNSEPQKSVAANYEEWPVEKMAVPEDSDLEMANGETVEIRKPVSEKEFFQKRAIGEVSSLKMVEHILTSVEREYMKVVPSAFDDFNAKVALNTFLQVTGEITSDEHKQAEFALMQETESWCSALAARDKDISVANVRRYCENAKPMLSSQAMIALARFYRNLPYSEGVRGKFDFIITRLFSCPTQDQLRKLLFTRDEMLVHIKTLYADWSSISLYTADDDESNAGLTARTFQAFTAEAVAATEFDELIRSDFFNRIRLFKESITELFFAPLVAAAAIECNIQIGNSYVELIENEREKSNSAIVHEKYSYVDDQTVSEATGRTMELVDILRERTLELDEGGTAEAVEDEEKPVAVNKEQQKQIKPKTEPSRIQLATQDFLGMNRWLLVISMVLIMSSVGLFVWANYFAAEEVSSSGARNFDIANSPFKGELKLGKINGDTFYGVLLPSWETMTKEKQLDLLQRIHQAGPANGWVKVDLMNASGKTVAFASPTRMEVVAQ